MLKEQRFLAGHEVPASTRSNELYVRQLAAEACGLWKFAHSNAALQSLLQVSQLSVLSFSSPNQFVLQGTLNMEPFVKAMIHYQQTFEEEHESYTCWGFNKLHLQMLFLIATAATRKPLHSALC